MPASQRPLATVRRFFSELRPGVVAGAADDDPSGIATYSSAGAALGTSLLWTALITWPLMAAVQFMCARIGMVTGRGLAGAFPTPAILGNGAAITPRKAGSTELVSS